MAPASSYGDNMQCDVCSSCDWVKISQNMLMGLLNGKQSKGFYVNCYCGYSVKLLLIVSC